jgi:hypothetical protein
MRTIALLSICSLSALANAQVWCPSGATWNYNTETVFTLGCETRNYVGDTLFEGRVAQHIEVSGTYQFTIVDSVVSYAYDFYTSVDDSLVYSWEAGLMEWDTLYWFSASPGDQWWPAGSGGCPGDWGKLEVLDTASVSINGVPLRSLTMTYLDELGQTSGDNVFTIRTLLGAPLMIIPAGGCLAVEAGGDLRTYADEDFLMYDSGVASLCDLITGLVEPKVQTAAVLYPNPTTTEFSIDGIAGQEPCEITLIDDTGRPVKRWSRAVGSTRFDVHGSSPGCYTLVVERKNGRALHLKLIIE